MTSDLSVGTIDRIKGYQSDLSVMVATDLREIGSFQINLTEELESVDLLLLNQKLAQARANLNILETLLIRYATATFALKDYTDMLVIAVAERRRAIQEFLVSEGSDPSTRDISEVARDDSDMQSIREAQRIVDSMLGTVRDIKSLIEQKHASLTRGMSDIRTQERMYASILGSARQIGPRSGRSVRKTDAESVLTDDL